MSIKTITAAEAKELLSFCGFMSGYIDGTIAKLRIEYPNLVWTNVVFQKTISDLMGLQKQLSKVEEILIAKASDRE